MDSRLDEPLDVLEDGKLQEVNSKVQKYTQKHKNYNLDEGLKLKVMTLQKSFQFSSTNDQIIPIMVSVQAIELKSQQQLEQVKELERPSIDLICLIDNSGSMKGPKIKNVKRALTYMLNLLNNNDRLSLIIFNSKATKLCNLIRVNESNKIILQNCIDGIQAQGGTSINSGMEIAFKVLKNRQHVNQVSSIFLLSDGLDSSAFSQVQLSLKNSQIKNNFNIYSFGFGQDHDAEMMNQICNLKDGSFYFIENIDQIEEFFCEALGGLFSVIAQEVTIEVKLNFTKKYEKFFKNATVSKTFGKQWKVICKDEHYSIYMNKLITGTSKDFLFEINIPAQNIKSIKDYERNAEIINATVSLIPINSIYTTKISKSSNLILTLFLEKEKISEDGELNGNVEYNYLRVLSSEAMDQALQQYQNDNNNNTHEILTTMLNRIQKSSQNTQQKLSQVSADLLEFKNKSNPGTFDRVTEIKILSSINSFMKQEGGRFLGSFTNSIQKKMVVDSMSYKQFNSGGGVDNINNKDSKIIKIDDMKLKLKQDQMQGCSSGTFSNSIQKKMVFDSMNYKQFISAGVDNINNNNNNKYFNFIKKDDMKLQLNQDQMQGSSQGEFSNSIQKKIVYDFMDYKQFNP